jgi:hypothetical protein
MIPVKLWQILEYQIVCNSVVKLSKRVNDTVGHTTYPVRAFKSHIL